ncbi:MAG: sodium:solute symporter [Clostridia bacterium]|nr:sodium:solute symporter [Clostridia bacterium]
MVIQILFLVIFFAVMIGVGFYCRKSAKGVNGFVLGGREVGPWLTAFAFGTSYFSAVIFVGYAGKFGWNFGLASTWIGLGNAFIGSLLAWSVLGRRTRIMTHHLGSKTMPDFFGLRFDSKPLKLIAAIIVFIFLIPYTASLYNGLSRLFTMAFPGIEYTWCVIAMSVLTGIYVLVGGYMATAINDFIQGIFMIFGILAVIVAVLNQNGGFMGSMEALADKAGWEYASFFGADPLFLVFVVILTSLGTWGLPQMVGKFYAIKDEDAIKKGTVISTVFAIIVAGGCYFLGGFSRLFSDATEKGTPAVGFDNLIPTMLENLGPVLIGIVLVLVLSASMSTLSSLVLTSGSTITLDLILPLKKKEVSEKKQMLIIRLFIAFFIVISAIIAIFQQYSKSESVAFIADLMGVSWGVLAGSFIGPFLWGLYSKKISRASVYVSFVLGVTLGLVQLAKSVIGFDFGVAFLDGLVFKSSIHSGAIAMLLSIAIVPLVSLFTKKQSKDRLEEIFSCYNKEVTVKATAVLESKENEKKH